MKIEKKSFSVGVLLLSILCFAAGFCLHQQALSMQAQQSQVQEQLTQDQALLEASIEKRQNVPATNLMMLDFFVKKVDASLAVLESGKVSAFIATDGDRIGHSNQVYGIGTGNKLVAAMAECMKQSFPDKERDILCNVGSGSDEFYMFLLNRNSKEEIEQELQVFMEKVRHAEVESNGYTLAGTCSMGVTLVNDSGTDFLTLYKKADKALYQAKENGRNRFVFSQEE